MMVLSPHLSALPSAPSHVSRIPRRPLPAGDAFFVLALSALCRFQPRYLGWSCMNVCLMWYK